MNPKHSCSLESDLAKQTSNKVNLQEAVADSCSNSVATIKRSLKLIDINTNFQRMTKEEALQKLETLKDSGEDVTLKFRDLKMDDDLTKSCEAEPIINTAFGSPPTNKVRVCFEFERNGIEQAVELLPAFKRHPKQIPK